MRDACSRFTLLNENMIRYDPTLVEMIRYDATLVDWTNILSMYCCIFFTLKFKGSGLC